MFGRLALVATVAGCSFEVAGHGAGDGGLHDTSAAEAGQADGAPSDAIMLDASGPDAPPDAIILPPAIALVVSAHAAAANASTLTYAVNVPAGTSRFLIASVQLGANCPADMAPTVQGVTFNGVALARVTTILGTPCGAGTTRSEQWQLVAPAMGSHNLVITLSAAVKSNHSGALVFTGVDQASPIRASATGSGTGASAMVTVQSAAGDVVVSTVGQGNGVAAPGTGQTSVFINNVNTSNTLNNSAASTIVGAASVTASWSFTASDEWQSIASSLRHL